MPTVIDNTETKQAVRKFWGNRPCGLIHSNQPVESSAFFQETEAHRFKIHTDWDKPFLKELLRQTGIVTCRELFVGPLDEAEARRLTQSLFAAANVPGEPLIESIVHEADGSPFLLEQLTHYGMMNERAATAGISLTTMLEERMEQLPPGIL